MKKLLTITALMCTLALMISCSGGDKKNGTVKSKTVEQIDKLDPKAYAEDVKNIHLSVYRTLDGLLDAYPEVNEEFAAKYRAAYNEALAEMYKYGESLDKKDPETKFQYLLACAANDGMGERQEIQNKLDSRFEEFTGEGVAIDYNEITRVNILGLVIDFEKVRNDFPEKMEEYGIK